MPDEMTSQTTATVMATVPIIRAEGAAITARMYERLFADPDLRAMFVAAAAQRGGEPGDQHQRLAAAILVYAEHIDRPELLRPIIARIADRHVATGVRREHYAVVADAFLHAMREVLGAACTDDMLDAWSDAYGFLAEALMEEESKRMAAMAAPENPGGAAAMHRFI